MNISYKKFKTTIDSRLWSVGLITGLIHAVVALVLRFVHIGLLSSTGDDALYFDYASQIAHLIKTGAYHFGDVYFHHWYPLFLGGIFSVFGNSMLLGIFINVVLAAATAVLIYAILRSYHVSENRSFWGALVIANGYASYAYHSSLLLKESWIMFLALLVIYLGRRMSQGRGNRIAIFAGIIASWILLRNLRFFIGFAAVAAVMVDWFLNAEVPRMKKIATGFIMVAAISLASIGLSGDGLFRAQTVMDAARPEVISKTRHYSERASTANHIPVIQADPEDQQASVSKTGFIQSFAHALFGPFPNQLPIGRYVATLLDTGFVYLILAVLVISMIRRRFGGIRATGSLVLASGIIMVAVALGSDNIGANIRQRMPAVVIGSVAACIALKRARDSQPL